MNDSARLLRRELVDAKKRISPGKRRLTRELLPQRNDWE
jgi:hypothetical protein